MTPKSNDEYPSRKRRHTETQREEGHGKGKSKCLNKYFYNRKVTDSKIDWEKVLQCTKALEVGEDETGMDKERN